MTRLRSILLVFAAALSASPEALKYRTGLEAFRNRDFATAERQFGQLVRKDPGDAHAHKLLGMTYAAQEKYQPAAVEFAAACTKDHTEPDACYYLGRTDFTLGKLNEAVDAYRVALGVAANGTGRGRVLLGMGLAYEAKSDNSAAERYYREAVDAGEQRALIDYGLFLAKNGRSREALQYLEKAGATEEIERVSAGIKGQPKNDLETAVVPLSFTQSTLPMTVRNGATGEKHLIETMIAGVAAFDYDGDGWPDIFVANGATIPDLKKSDRSYYNRLFHNNRDGTFSDVTERAGLAGEGFSMGVAAADYDNDGYIDLFVTGVASNHLYRNRGDGTFEDVSAKAGLSETGKWAVAAGWFDYDNDGLLDLFVVRYVEWAPSSEKFCGFEGNRASGQAVYRQYCNPREYKPLANALYRNLGNGKFQDVSVESGIAGFKGKGMGVAFGDYDGDGRLDVFIANDTVPNFLFHNDGNGKFHDVATEVSVAFNNDGKALSSMGVDFRDYDNDGTEDLFVTALSNETFPLFRNIGEGRFADVTYPSGLAHATLPWTGWSAGLFDFNNDGRKDIFVACGHVMDNAEMSSDRKTRQPDFVYLNRGGGKFQPQQLPGEAMHRGAAFADFDHDGKIDVVVTRLNEAPFVLRNTTQSQAHWIELRLVGHRSNRDGIGAMVHVVAASGEQWNRVTMSVGYGGSSDRIVHFGLGNDAVVKRIDIAWPSGVRHHLENVPTDRLMTIEER